ncbi:hypothetical protein H0H93_007457, partial [Arthromyces matolae]
VSPFDDDEFGRTVWLSVRGPPNIESQHWSPSDSPEPDQPDLELSIQTWAHSKTIFSTLFTPFDLQELEILEVSPAVSAKILKENFGRLTLLHTISIVEELYCKATDEVADALFGDDVSPTSLQSRSWYLGIRNSRLNPRVVDIDAQNEELSIVQNNFLATITAPLPFPALKCLKNVSTGNADLSLRLGVVFLLRQTLGIPLREVYLHPMYGGTSLDGLDCAMMRQSVESKLTSERVPKSLKPPGKDKPSWFRVAFVCTEWRRVAIDCATLWTSFSHENRVEWLTQVIIPRSKNALLSVNMTLDPSRVTFWEGAHFLLRDHSRRIREFGLNFLALLGWQPLEVKCLLSRLIANPLPSLEILHVSITGDAARLKTTCIPSNVLGEVHAPNLKSLTLIGEVKLAPVAPRVTLLITNLTLEYRGTSSVFEIISLLESSKKLQNLTLKLTAHSVDADSSSSSVNLKHYFRSPIVLRELKRFTLVDTCKRCLSILSSISCPAATNINVKVLPFYVPFESEGLVQKLATLIHPVKSLTIKVCTDFDETLSLLVRGPLRLGNIENRDQSSWESPPSANFSSSSSSSSSFESPIQTDLVELYIQTSIPRSDKTAFSTLLNPFDFQDLEILEMPPGVPTNILKAKFGSLSLLHTISIVGDVYSHATRGVVEALVGDEVSPDESRSWYLGVRNSRLNPRIVDVDAENEDLAIGEKPPI